MSDLEQQLAFQIGLQNIPQPVTEHRFHPKRRWKFDFAWPEHQLAVEVEGGVWTSGRHSRGAGFVADCEKYNEALLAGWRVIRVTGRHIANGAAVDWVWRAWHAAYQAYRERLAATPLEQIGLPYAGESKSFGDWAGLLAYVVGLRELGCWVPDWVVGEIEGLAAAEEDGGDDALR